MTMKLRALGWFAAITLGAGIPLPSEAHYGGRSGGSHAGHARSAHSAPAVARSYSHAPARVVRHYSPPPRPVSVARPVVVVPAPIRYVAPPVVYAAAPAYAAAYAYAPPVAPPAAYPPSAYPQGVPPGSWYAIQGPFMAIDGSSFIAGGVTYVLSGLRSWDVATPQGAAARARLQQLLQSGQVSVWRIANDGYGRAIARVIVNGAEIAQLMRSEGYAPS